MSNIYFLENWQDARIYIKREDLHPFSFGGNKVKIAAELMKDAREKGCDALVSYGSPASNMNRAVAHMARSAGMRCYCIMKQDAGDPGLHRMPLNERFVRDSGAEVICCRPDNIRETVEEVLALSASRGEKPYYIYGNSSGEGNEEVLMRAYGKQYWPVREYENQEGCSFGHIFLPVGTAATISGLMASISEGCEVDDPKVQLHGISIARSQEAVLASMRRFLSSCGYDTPECLALADVTDRYVGGGYGAGDLEDLILREFTVRGLPLDPVYTAKAFDGMLKEIERLGITGDVLFFHTGGLPLFYDWYHSRGQVY